MGQSKSSRRDRNVSFDLETKEKKDKLRELARGSGMTVARYVRAVIVDWAIQNNILVKRIFTIQGKDIM